ncbi:MAG: Ig-like domain-containing protein [Clostridia bacterium]|nr:Ig-like domain-containing protein [Clostridia bacterium]
MTGARWSSEDPYVADVDTWGSAVAVSTGSTVFHCGEYSIPVRSYSGIGEQFTFAKRHIATRKGAAFTQAVNVPEELRGQVRYTSSRPAFVKVDNTGKVTVIKGYTNRFYAQITATLGDYSASYYVWVLNAATTIGGGRALTLNQGYNYNLATSAYAPWIKNGSTFKVTDTVGMVTYKSNNSTVLGVTSTGILVPRKGGKAVITVTEVLSKRTTQYTVTVRPAPTAVALSPATVNMTTSTKPITLKVTQSPASAYKNLKWWSTDESVVTVTDTGVITPVGPGSAVVYARAYDYAKKDYVGKWGRCAVTVTEDYDYIAYDKANDWIATRVGASFTPKLNVEPATGAPITYKAANSRVAVNAAGKVTAKAAGYSYVYATTNNGLKATQKVWVLSSVTRIENGGTIGLKMSKGEMVTLKPRVYSGAYTFTETAGLLSFASNNTRVAKVDAWGRVTAVGVGKAYITVKSAVSGKTCKYYVVVSAADASVPKLQNFRVDNDVLSLNTETGAYTNTKYYFSNCNYIQNVTVSDTAGILVVDQTNRVLTPRATGTTTLVVKYGNDVVDLPEPITITVVDMRRAQLTAFPESIQLYGGQKGKLPVVNPGAFKLTYAVEGNAFTVAADGTFTAPVIQNTVKNPNDPAFVSSKDYKVTATDSLTGQKVDITVTVLADNSENEDGRIATEYPMIVRIPKGRSVDLKELAGLFTAQGWNFDAFIPENAAFALADADSGVISISGTTATALGQPGETAVVRVSCDDRVYNMTVQVAKSASRLNIGFKEGSFMQKEETFICDPGTTFDLQAYIEGCAEPVAKWSSSNTAVATISQNGVLTVRKPGETTISASYAGLSEQVKIKICAEKPTYFEASTEELFFSEQNQTQTFTINTDTELYDGAFMVDVDYPDGSRGWLDVAFEYPNSMRVTVLNGGDLRYASGPAVIRIESNANQMTAEVKVSYDAEVYMPDLPQYVVEMPIGSEISLVSDSPKAYQHGFKMKVLEGKDVVHLNIDESMPNLYFDFYKVAADAVGEAAVEVSYKSRGETVTQVIRFRVVRSLTAEVLKLYTRSEYTFRYAPGGRINLYALFNAPDELADKYTQWVDIKVHEGICNDLNAGGWERPGDDGTYYFNNPGDYSILFMAENDWDNYVIRTLHLTDAEDGMRFFVDGVEITAANPCRIRPGETVDITVESGSAWYPGDVPSGRAEMTDGSTIRVTCTESTSPSVCIVQVADNSQHWIPFEIVPVTTGIIFGDYEDIDGNGYADEADDLEVFTRTMLAGQPEHLNIYKKVSGSDLAISGLMNENVVRLADEDRVYTDSANVTITRNGADITVSCSVVGTYQLKVETADGFCDTMEFVVCAYAADTEQSIDYKVIPDIDPDRPSFCITVSNVVNGINFNEVLVPFYADASGNITNVQLMPHWKNFVILSYEANEPWVDGEHFYYQYVRVGLNGNVVKNDAQGFRDVVMDGTLPKSEQGMAFRVKADGTAVLTKFAGTPDANGVVTVPGTYMGHTVTEIGNNNDAGTLQGAFEGNTTLKKVSLPDTITVIGQRAFANCTNLSEME